MRWNLTPEQRFWNKVDPCRTDGCAIWLGATTRDGYGQFWFNGKTILAHHFLPGKPPKGFEWDHVLLRGCRHHNCIWLGHLELVTHTENALRGDTGKVLAAIQRTKTHCPQGHAYDESNTALDLKGWRHCRNCDRIRHAAHPEWN